MSEWFETLDGLHDRTWTLLAECVADTRPAARFPALASLGADGAPEVRCVALRRADRGAGAVDVYADIASDKIAGIAADPRVSLHLWEAALDLQLRLRGAATILPGSAARPIWDTVPPASRGNYGVTPAPGTPIASDGAYTRAPDPERFAVLRIAIAQIDVVHLSADYHRRALFMRTNGWTGHWLAP